MLTRRGLLKSIAGTALAAGSLGLTASVFANDDVLPFRNGSKLLQLNYNENSTGMSPLAIAAAQEAVRNSHNRYPDAFLDALRAAIANSHSVGTNQVMLGSGSTEILYMVVDACAQHGATLIDTAPTFGSVRTYAATLGMPTKIVPVNSDFTTSIDAMKAAANTVNGPVLINLCNPNNPTGTIIPEADLAAWISDAPENHTFLMDEAYFDYAEAENSAYGSMLPLVKSGRENLIISRTFSKVHGMAGMRVGYGIATEKTANRIGKFTNMVNVSAPGAAAATASLKDTEFYKASLISNQKAKGMLLETLSDLALEHIPSSTNFVLHRINGKVAEYQRRMRANNILVGRRMTDEDGWNRLSLGTTDDMLKFTKTMRVFRERGWV